MNFKKLLTITAILSAPFFASAQNPAGVSINAVVSPPDPSAMLDVVSSNKGLLIPRVSLTSVTDVTTIPNPANSLMVYNTNAAISGVGAFGAGFYYNAGTASSPAWKKVGDAENIWTLHANGTDIFRTSGKVGIGTITPTTELDIVGDPSIRLNNPSGTGIGWNLPTEAFFRAEAGATRIVSDGRAAIFINSKNISDISDYRSGSYFQIIGNVGCFCGNGVVLFEVDKNGNATAKGDVTANSFINLSDSTLKKNIVPIINSLSKVKQMRGVNYNWKESAQGEKETGFLAQEVEKIFPELVKAYEPLRIDNEKGHTPSTPGIPKKGVNYIGLIPHLVEAIQEQQTMIEKLQEQNMVLTNRINALEKKK